MKTFKPLIVLASILIAVTIVIPALLVLPFQDGKSSGKLGEDVNSPQKALANSPDGAVTVSVYRSAKEKIEKVSMENYLVGVVGAEMPAEFNEEALKAQALTARTYIVKQLLSKNTALGLPQGAEVTDTQQYQVYNSDDELRSTWGMDYDWKHKKVLDAVRATAGQIITYNNEPITATFFSTSNGYTENSEDYWSGSFPYLRSVASPWDKDSPKYTSQKVISVKDFQRKLGVRLSGGLIIGKITSFTAGKRVATVNFNGKTLTGKTIREKLGLNSTDFSWQRKGSNIIITTKGYGHGVGMSQYGANGMAAEGKSYKDIILHYYTGVQITSADSMLASIAGK